MQNRHESLAEPLDVKTCFILLKTLGPLSRSVDSLPCTAGKGLEAVHVRRQT